MFVEMLQSGVRSSAVTITSALPTFSDLQLSMGGRSTVMSSGTPESVMDSQQALWWICMLSVVAPQKHRWSLKQPRTEMWECGIPWSLHMQ